MKTKVTDSFFILFVLVAGTGAAIRLSLQIIHKSQLLQGKILLPM